MSAHIASTDPLLSIDQLDINIVRLAARINTATHDLLVLVREFDERAGLRLSTAGRD